MRGSSDFTLAPPSSTECEVMSMSDMVVDDREVMLVDLIVVGDDESLVAKSLRS